MGKIGSVGYKLLNIWCGKLAWILTTALHSFPLRKKGSETDV